jgi:uncharacterized membrane protein YedE/YeeE
MADLTVSTPLPAARTRVRVPRWATLGILFGFLSAAAIALYGPIGVSGTYPRFVGAILRRTAPGYAAANPYLVKMGSLITPETMLVVGLLVGGVLASLIWRTHAPGIETPHPGETSTARRYRDAFIGGVLLIFGARLAGGCTSGHIISGMTQLAISGFLFTAAVFASGIVTARLLKGGH